MRYKYKSISSDGRESEGLYVGDSESGLINMLRERKELIISIERDVQSEAQIELFKKKVKKKDLALFCRQFYTMISAGLGIVSCLEILVAQTQNKTFKNAIADTYEDVQKGLTLSESMKKHTNVFPSCALEFDPMPIFTTTGILYLFARSSTYLIPSRKSEDWYKFGLSEDKR